MEKILKGKKFFTFEKWLACFTGILLVMLAVFSCNNVLVKDGGSLIIAMPGARAATASSYTIELTGSNGTTQSKTVAGGASVQFDNLLVGSYTVIVDGKDENDKIVTGGSSKATVVAGKTASVMVELIEGVGDFTGLKDAVATGGMVKVLKSIDIEECLQISNTVTILPAYQDVTLRNITSSHLINVSTGGALTVGGGEYTITLDGNDNSSFVISTGAGCSVHLNENSIITKGSRGVHLGGGTSESSLSLAGGVITGNKNNGVYLGTKSQFDMSSGSITGSFTGVSVSAESQFSMTGGSITGNSSNSVAINDGGVFTMEDGSITGNSSTGVYMSVDGEFIMRGGSISDNGTQGVFVSGEFTMTGGSITGNSFEGVTIYDGGAFTMEDGSISDNGSDGVDVRGAFTMTGGSISGNTTGGVNIYTDATFTMGGSAIVDPDNDVSLVQNTSITVSGELTGDAPVATITPKEYTEGTQVLTAGDGVTLADKIGKFAVTPNNGTEWTINESGALQKVQ